MIERSTRARAGNPQRGWLFEVLRQELLCHSGVRTTDVKPMRYFGYDKTEISQELSHGLNPHVGQKLLGKIINPLDQALHIKNKNMQ